jgi:pimeloyl-ACP methyl ester carboxylesterase
MFKTKIITTNPNITQLETQGLKGRVLRIASKKPESAGHNILLIYGHHASLERYATIADNLSQYGEVTMPDLPGFGGMESFRKLGKEPDIAEFADYMAAFIRENYQDNNVTIVGFSYGLPVATLMLQRYPELERQINSVVSIVGFASAKALKLSKKAETFYRLSAKTFKNYPVSLIAGRLITNDISISLAYGRFGNSVSKFDCKSGQERKKVVKEEISLWQNNDFWTYAWVVYDTFTIDLTSHKLKIPLLHVQVSGDQYFNATQNVQDLQKIYPNTKVFSANLATHAPTSLEDPDEVEKLIPVELKIALVRLAKDQKSA